MDQTLVDTFRKNLEAKATEEIRRVYESGDKARRSPEEHEAMRQFLDERRTQHHRTAVAFASAILLGMIGGAYSWWQVGPGVLVLLAGAGSAVLGFALWYIPDLIPRA